MENELLARYQRALQHYLEGLAFEPLVLLLCGSLARGAVTETSDIDVLLVMPEGTTGEDFAEEDHLGVRVQVFRSTEAELLAGFDWESRGLSRQRSSLVAGGKVIRGDHALGARLIHHALAAWETPVEPMNPAHARSLLNYIRNQIPGNLERLSKRSEYGFHLTWMGMMDKYFVAAHQLNRCLLPRHETIGADLPSVGDPQLGRAFCQALEATTFEEKKRRFYEVSAWMAHRLEAYLSGGS